MTRPLAIDGHPPRFASALHVGGPAIDAGGVFPKLVSKILAAGRFSNDGPYVQELERRIATLHEVRHCIAVCNATVGLQIAMKALNLKGEVIAPSFTFTGTVNAIRWIGLTPVLCDISPRSLTLDPTAVERLISPRTSAILGVHLFGELCDVRSLRNIAKKRGVKLLYDAAHAFGCGNANTTVGSFGDAEVLSFHATKVFHTFEGGAILTNDDALAERMRLLRNNGIRWYEDAEGEGTNGKMAEIPAAYGLSRLPLHAKIVARNAKLHELYAKHLAGMRGITIRAPKTKTNHHYMVIFVDQKKFGMSRDVLCEFLWKEQVLARKYFAPGWHKLHPDKHDPLPVTEDVSEQILCLPTGPRMSGADVKGVCELIRAAHERADDVVRWHSGR